MENLDSLKIASNTLRSYRKKLNLSVKEISLELRLEENIIRDIESANFDNFSSYLFLKGYLKNYADFLEIKINLPEYKERKKNKIKKEKNKVVRKNYINYILVLIVMVLIFIFLIENNKIFVEAENKTILIQKDSVSRDKDNAEKIYQEEKSITDINEKPLELTQDQILIIEYSDDSWTEIINSNGDIVFFDLVKGGKSIKIKILTPFEILLGDATAVNIKYNNRVVKVPYFNPDNNVGKIKINN